MSAKRHLHLLLVASLIVFLFALVPANAEETNLKLIDIEHHNSKEENNIGIQVGNYSKLSTILDPLKIKNIKILKSPVDLSMYGFMGSGGVIEIKTKWLWKKYSI